MAEKRVPAAPSAEITAAQIAAWKREYGRVYRVESDGKQGYLRKPNRTIIGAASVLGGSDGIKIAEVIVENCWLGGDEELKTNDDYFLGIVSQINALTETAQVELKEV